MWILCKWEELGQTFSILQLHDYSNFCSTPRIEAATQSPHHLNYGRSLLRIVYCTSLPSILIGDHVQQLTMNKLRN